MARARNIKPALFNNDELAENQPLGRLLFIGLWTLADFKGDLEWREKRIKAQLLPYDNCDIKKLAINLDKTGFIRFYSVGERIYINIVNFDKHQNPHKNEREKGSEIPSFCKNGRQAIDFTTLTINRDKNGTNPDLNETNRADSFNLIPDSLNPDPLNGSPENRKKTSSAKADIELVFNYWVAVMKKGKSAILNDKRKKAIQARMNEGYTVDQIKQAILGCSMTPHNMGKNDNNKIYNDLELICRDGSNVERFASNAEQTTVIQQYSPVTERNLALMQSVELK